MILFHTLGIFLAAFSGLAFLWELKVNQPNRARIFIAAVFSVAITLALTF